MHPAKDPIQTIKDCPPFLMHALARMQSGKKRLPLETIVKRSGLPERTYLRTARRDSWKGIKFEYVEAMRAGTGVNPFQMRNHWRLLRKHNYDLPFLNVRQKRIFVEICERRVSQMEAEKRSVGNGDVEAHG